MAEDTQPEDLPLYTPEPSEPQTPEPLLYDPLEPELGQVAAPDAADGSSLFFRIALAAAVLLVIVVFARGFWPFGRTHRSPPEPAAATRSAVSAAPQPAAAPARVEASPSPAPPARRSAPVTVEESAPKPAPAKPERTKAAEAPEPKPLRKAATPARQAAAPPVRRVPQPWEEGPQPPGLLKPGPGVEEPVPLGFPRYSYPAAARGTGLQVDVRVAVLVDEKGRVIDARVREGAPPDMGFAETALAAARRMSFQPATRDDVPGKMWTEVILQFAEPGGLP